MSLREELPYRPCVGLVILDRDGRILVGERSDTPGAWQMPQGGIDPGEDPRDAALREMREEIGTDRAEILAETSDWVTYELPDALLGKVWGGRFRGQRQKWFALRFLGRDRDIDLGGKHREFDRVRWSGRAEVLAHIVPFKRAVYDAVLDEFSPLLAP